MKLVSCKRCGAPNLSWALNAYGKWSLMDKASGVFHDCPVREIKEVACKYCKANDLWWNKEIMPDGTTKNVLMESWGLPHGCEERQKQLNAANQAKKDEYAAEKLRINAIPDGSHCNSCTNGILPGIHFSSYAMRCNACDGSGRITAAVKRKMLYNVRKRIWPTLVSRRQR